MRLYYETVRDPGRWGRVEVRTSASQGDASEIVLGFVHGGAPLRFKTANFGRRLEDSRGR